MTWRPLDSRSPVITALVTAGIAVGSGIPLTFSLRNDGHPLWQVGLLVAAGILLVVGIAAAGEWLRWRYTRFRITDERVELRFSWVVHRQRSIPRDRIRTVDLTANPLLRLFGVVKVQVGTGQRTGERSQLVLSPLARAEAEELRRELLNRPTPVSQPAIATLQWSWIRYAPVSVTTPILGVAAFGGLLQISDWFGLQRTVIGEAGDLLRGFPLLVMIATLVLAGVLVGVLGSLGLFVELWSGYRLTREHGQLRVRRGLLTTRSVSLDERRLRGVEVVEPLGARLLGAARVDAVATGLRSKDHDERGDPKTLLPPAPLPDAHRVAAEVVGEPVSPTVSARLRQHPGAARGRRLRWGIGAVLLIAFGLTLFGLLVLAGIAIVIGLPVAVALALDAYRNLGHGMTGDYLVTRHGAGSRRTVALRRGGVIGWTITSSPFQRRAGLVTLSATTAANRGAYPIYDVDSSEGLAFADEAVPGLLTPFLETDQRAIAGLAPGRSR